MSSEIEQFKPVDYADPMVARILDAAEQCVHRYGIRKTSMGEVAKVGKLSRGSIYRHFADKESLVEGMFRRLQEQFLNRAEASLALEPTLVDKLTLSIVQGRADRETGIFASLAQTEPETVAVMFLDARFYSRSIAFWPPHIELARQSGEISADIPVDMAADFIMRLAVSMVMFPQMGLDISSAEEVRNYVRQVLCAGLGAQV